MSSILEAQIVRAAQAALAGKLKGGEWEVIDGKGVFFPLQDEYNRNRRDGNEFGVLELNGIVRSMSRSDAEKTVKNVNL